MARKILQKKKARQIEEKEVLFELSNKQLEIFNSDSRFRVVVAGRRFGKSYLTAVMMIIHAMKHEMHNVYYITTTNKNTKEVMLPMLQSLIHPSFLAKPVNITDQVFTFKTGSRIRLFGAEKLDNFRGPSCNLCVLDEFAFLKQDVWFRIMRPTLATTLGKAVFISTPDPKSGEWAKSLFEYCDNDDEWGSFHYTSLDGGLIPESEIQSARRSMCPKKFAIEYEASFETIDGLVYYSFTKDNIKDLPKNNDEKILHIGMDFNVDPMTAVVGAKDKDNFYIFDEITIKNSNTDEICQEISRKYKDKFNKINVYPDPSGKARKTSACNNTDFSIIKSYGLNVVAPKRAPAIQDRVNEVNAMICNADGNRRLFISKACKDLTNSMRSCTYKENTKIVDKSKNIEHWADALGYLIHSLYPIVSRPDPKPLSVNYR